MTNQLVIADIVIRQDAEGRYCVNDLHRAAGGEKRHQPSDWMRLQQTQELVSELEKETPGIPGVSERETTGISVVILEGRNGGTFVALELVYAYANWISPAFYLKVIRTYHAVSTQRPARNGLVSMEAPSLPRFKLYQYPHVKRSEKSALIAALERCPGIGDLGRPAPDPDAPDYDSSLWRLLDELSRDGSDVGDCWEEYRRMKRVCWGLGNWGRQVFDSFQRLLGVAR